MNMAMTVKQLKTTTPLTTSYVTMYTTPASTNTIVKEITITNITSSAAQAFVSLVPSAGSASTANNIISSMNIEANGTVVVGLNMVMIAADFLSAKASAGTTLNITISGVEIA
jgi:Flp pilus assembly CpaE family ATPase